MGCAGSKDEGGQSEGATDPKDIKVAESAASNHTSMTGYHTDVEENKKHAFTEQLVRSPTSVPAGDGGGSSAGVATPSHVACRSWAPTSGGDRAALGAVLTRSGRS